MTAGRSGAVLVTGATGTVGRDVVAALRAAGEPVRAGVRDPAGADPAGDAVRFDFADPGTWPGAFDGVDRMFLLRPPAISDVARYVRPVIELAAAHRVRRVVFLSVLGVNPAMPHWRVERDLRASGLAATLLRPSFFAQNLLTAYGEDIRTRDRLRLPAGRGRTAFVDSRDVAEVAARALAEPDRYDGAYDLTGLAALSYDEVAALLTAALGRTIRYEPVGLRRYRRELLDAGHPPGYVRVQLAINLAARLGLAARTTPTLGVLLGRPPRTLAAFCADHAAAFRARPGPSG